MSGGNRSYTDKVQLRKTLYIECMKHNRKLNVNFLAGKQNMKQCRPKTLLVCKFSVSILCPRVVGKLVFLEITFFSVVKIF